jgi:hypothetical protein
VPFVIIPELSTGKLAEDAAMSDQSEGQAPAPSDEQVREVIWERIGNRSVGELPKCLGFTPELKALGENRRVFEDSGFEVTLWVGKTGKIAMVNVRKL